MPWTVKSAGIGWPFCVVKVHGARVGEGPVITPLQTTEGIPVLRKQRKGWGVASGVIGVGFTVQPSKEDPTPMSRAFEGRDGQIQTM